MGHGAPHEIKKGCCVSRSCLLMLGECCSLCLSRYFCWRWEVWSIRSADEQRTEQGERRSKGREEFLCLNSSCLEIWKIFILKFYLFRFLLLLGLPGGSDGKEFTCKAGDLVSIPGLGRSPGEANGNPLQYSCLENSMCPWLVLLLLLLLLCLQLFL